MLALCSSTAMVGWSYVCLYPLEEHVLSSLAQSDQVQLPHVGDLAGPSKYSIKYLK